MHGLAFTHAYIHAVRIDSCSRRADCVRTCTARYIHGVSLATSGRPVGCEARSALSPNYFIPGIYLLRNSCIYRDKVHARARTLHTAARSLASFVPNPLAQEITISTRSRERGRARVASRRESVHMASREKKKYTPYQFAKYSSPERSINRAVALAGDSKNCISSADLPLTLKPVTRLVCNVFL